MKISFKKCAVLLLCTCTAVTVSVLAACGDGSPQLIRGNFSKEATSEQLTEVRTLLSDASEDQITEGVSNDSENSSLRLLSEGKVEFSVVGEENGKPAELRFGVNMYLDHIMTVSTVGDTSTLRGSGNVDFGVYANINAQGATGPLSNINLEANINGSAYNDSDYLYVNGAVLIDLDLAEADSTQGPEISREGKTKLPFEDTFNAIRGANIGGDLSMFAGLIDSAGTTVYVDDGETLKVKISFSKEAWAQYFCETLTNTADIEGLDEQTMIESVNFRKYDLYLEFDKDTENLIGYGIDVNANMSTELTAQNVTGKISFVTDFSTWVVTSDLVPSDLPDDLGNYVDVNTLT